MKDQWMHHGCTFVLIWGLLVSVGCTVADRNDQQARSQELIVLSLQDIRGSEPAVTYGYSALDGWHMRGTESLLSTNYPGTVEVNVRHQALFDGMDFAAGSGARFSAASPGAGGFTGTIAAARSFQGQSPRTSSFSAGAPGARAFTGTLSAGNVGQCSLRGFCDFALYLCESLGGGIECDRGALQECYATIDQDLANIPASAIPVVCAYADFIDCSLNALRAGVADEAALQRICRGEYNRLAQVMGTGFDDFDDDNDFEFEFEVDL